VCIWLFCWLKLYCSVCLGSLLLLFRFFVLLFWIFAVIFRCHSMAFVQMIAWNDYSLTWPVVRKFLLTHSFSLTVVCLDCFCRLPKLYICESCLMYVDSQVSLDRHVVCVNRYMTLWCQKHHCWIISAWLFMSGSGWISVRSHVSCIMNDMVDNVMNCQCIILLSILTHTHQTLYFVTVLCA